MFFCPAQVGEKVLAAASAAGQSLEGLPGVLFTGELVHEVGHLCCPNLVRRLGGSLERCWPLVCVRRLKEPGSGMKDRSNGHRIPLLSLGLLCVGTTLGEGTTSLREHLLPWLILPGDTLIKPTRDVSLI